MPEKTMSIQEKIDLLNAAPENAARITGSEWVKILSAQPQLAELCPADALSSDDLFWLILKRPQLHSHFSDWKRMSPVKVEHLLAHHPETITDQRLALLDGTSWSLLLSSLPGLADRCDWKKLNASHWSILLDRCPEMIRFWDPDRFPEQPDRRRALDWFYSHIFHDGKRDWQTMCMLCELTKLQSELERPVREMENGLFGICDETESAETFVMLSMMNPAGAANFLLKKIRQKKWDFIRRVITLQPDLLTKRLAPETLVPYFIMNAPADLALYAIQKTGSFAGEYTDSCKCNCFHALFIRIAEADPKWFLNPPETITVLSDALIHAGCDPDFENLQHHSFHSLAEAIKKSL